MTTTCNITTTRLSTIWWNRLIHYHRLSIHLTTQHHVRTSRDIISTDFSNAAVRRSEHRNACDWKQWTCWPVKTHRRAHTRGKNSGEFSRYQNSWQTHQSITNKREVVHHHCVQHQSTPDCFERHSDWLTTYMAHQMTAGFGRRLPVQFQKLSLSESPKETTRMYSTKLIRARQRNNDYKYSPITFQHHANCDIITTVSNHNFAPTYI